MSYRINTNVNALNSYANSTATNVQLSKSLSKLSSGLRISSAADDASGLAIADSLRSQASTLGQAINNANDAIGIIQIADKAMDEQLAILDTIKVKATQSAQDGQTTTSRRALQADITRLMEELDNIGTTTSYNGQTLLDGTYSNKEFQIGAYSNQTVKASIGATTSDKIGLTRFESSQTLTYAAKVGLKFASADGVSEVTIAETILSTGANTGLGKLAENINKASDQTGIRAVADVKWEMSATVTTGTIKGLTINGATIGDLELKAGDGNGLLVNAINAVKDRTGVEASLKIDGTLVLNSTDGRVISVAGEEGLKAMGMKEDTGGTYVGRLNLVRLDGRDIKIAEGSTGISNAQFDPAEEKGGAQASVALRDIKGQIDAKLADAMGFQRVGTASAGPQSAGVMTLTGAMAVMNIAESAQLTLDQIRSDLGSVQNQLESTVSNITVTQVNVKAAESQIRDVDFASESSNFSKHNILAQSGVYAMSQSNSVQQNVMSLLR